MYTPDSTLLAQTIVHARANFGAQHGKADSKFYSLVFFGEARRALRAALQLPLGAALGLRIHRWCRELPFQVRGRVLALARAPWAWSCWTVGTHPLLPPVRPPASVSFLSHFASLVLDVVRLVVAASCGAALVNVEKARW
jgi:hypothetical protein